MSDPEIKLRTEAPAPPDAPEPPSTPVDTGSQALEEALRSSFYIVKAIMVVMVIVFVFSGIRKVEPQERAIKFRFGKPAGIGDQQLLEPGLHWALPYPIEEVVKIPVGEIQTVEARAQWYAISREEETAGKEPPARPSLNPGVDGYTLTGDGNILHARVTLRYRIKDPLAYVFNFQSASNVVENVVNNAVLYAAVRSTVDDVLLNTAAFQDKVRARVIEQVDQLKLGITLEPLTVKVVAPVSLKSAFEEVISAQQDRSGAILKARGEADATLSKAQSEANALINQAKSDRTLYLREIDGRASEFSAQLESYQSNPELFRQRLLTETWQKVLANAQVKFIDLLPASSGGKPQELRLLLNREPESPKTNAPPQ